jgi:hypothetical protein
MVTYLPPGWPAGVHPPGSQDFERTAAAWLLDVVPPDYRLYGVLRRHPAALASLARHHLAACVEGARQGYRTARTELGNALPPHGVDAVLAAYRSEGRRLVATATAVGLVERALRGETFTPRLRDSRPGQGTAGPVADHGQPASYGTASRSGGNGLATASNGRAVSNGRAASNGQAASNEATSNQPVGNQAASRSTGAAELTGTGKKSGNAKGVTSGKAAGQGKRPRNGSASGRGKGRQLAAASDGV